jgi:hypothetical protein
MKGDARIVIPEDSTRRVRAAHGTTAPAKDEMGASLARP